MKKRLMIVLAAFTAIFDLSGTVHGSEKMSHLETIVPNIKNHSDTMPLYLDDAVKAIKSTNCGSMLGRNFSHSSHASHASHASHFSHYSSRPR